MAAKGESWSPIGVHDLEHEAFDRFRGWLLERTLEISKRVTGKPQVQEAMAATEVSGADGLQDLLA